MDPLTHTATGLFLGRAGLKRLTPCAMPILLLAANAPDIDIVATAGGALNYLHFHRHLTHSLLGMPLLGILTVLLVRGVARRPIHWLGAFVAALVAVGSHLLLDWTNLYGIRLLLPFSGAWQRLDLTQVVDLWIWGVLLLGIVGPFLARLVGSEISSGKTSSLHHGRGFAIFALAFVLLYNCGRGVLHGRALTVLDSRVYEGQPPARVAAFPTLNLLVWRGLIETSTFYEIQEINLAGRLDLNRGMIFHKPYPDPALDAARATPTFQTFLNFSQFPLWRITPVAEPDNGKMVEVFDLRFGTPVEPGFMVMAVLDSRGNVTRTAFQFGAPRPR
jgi:inner membrane protein